MPSSVYSVRAWDIPDRMDLEAQPRRETIESYVLTRAAERAWHKFNQHLEAGQGALWWIGGPGGCGKTHFLNYVIALQHRAGAMTAESSRRTTCGFELAGRVGAAEIEAYLLSVLAEQIGVHDEAGGLWRALRGAPAIEIALEQAARVGIHAITIAIDFALADCRSAEEYFDAVAAVAANAKRARCRFNVLVAARIHAPRSAAPLDIAAADSIECVDAAIRRTRDLNDAGATTVDRAYAGIEMLGFDPRAIYPFHPRAAAVLPAIAGPPATIAAIARIARDAELAHRERGYDPARVIFPADVVACAALAEHLATRLGDSGAAAHRIARGAADAFTGHEAELAREMVDTLIVEHLAGGAALTITEIEAQLPILASRIGEAWTRPALEGVLKGSPRKPAG